MKIKEGGVMDIQKDEDFEKSWQENRPIWESTKNLAKAMFYAGQAKSQAVPAQLDVNSILHDIDCYFDNGLSNTERTANNLLQSIYEKLSGEVKAQEPAK